MEVLKSTKILLKYCGLLPSYCGSFKYKLYYIFIFFNCTLFVPPQLAISYYHLDDLRIWTDSFGTSIELFLTAGKMIFVYIHNTGIKRQLEQFEENIEKKITQNRGKHYLAAETRSTLWVRRYFAWACTTVVIFFVSPVTISLVLYSIGKLDITGWIFPFKGIFPYNAESLIGYTITCVVEIFNGFVMTVVAIAVDLLFVGMALHIGACFKDLHDMILESDECLTSNRLLTGNGFILTDQQGEQLLKKYLIDCIKFQNRIYKYVKTINEIQEGTMMLEYFGSLVILCVQVFQASLNFGSGLILPNISFYFYQTGQLIIYAWYGTYITRQSELVIKALIETQWYRTRPSFRFFYRYMLERAQKPCRLSVYNFFFCSLESFTNVLNSTASIFALLQSLYAE